MARTTVTIPTRDGRCDASLCRPERPGPWPGVLVFMDGIGIRPALFDLAERIARSGYVVLLPDLFYRVGPYVAAEPAKIFSDLEFRKEWSAKYIASASQANVMSDTAAFLDVLASQPDVRSAKVGTTGYCMGGALSLAAAGHYSERVAAAASYHGSRLATDAADSPHLLAPRMKARVYVGGATEDPSFPDDMKARLDDALTAANVEHTIETYPARHGWVPADTPVHDPACAERHFETLFALFDASFRDA